MLLLLAAVGLGLLGVWAPLGPVIADDAQAIAVAPAVHRVPAAPQSRAGRPVDATERPEPVDVADNAFAVRIERVQLSPPPVLPVAMPKPLMGPPAPAPVPPPPPPPPPPVQVIGTWDDAKAPGVFLSLPQGVVLARLGDVLLSDFRVSGLTPHQITLVHVASKHEWRFNIARTGMNR